MQIYLEQRYLDNNIRNISKKSELDIVFGAPTRGSYFIYDSKGLSFIINADNPKKFLNVDFLTGKLGWRIKRAEHESNLKKALGKTKKSLHIFDATAGLLADSLIFLSLGHQVVAVEQSKIIYLLINDAIHRAQDAISFLRNIKLMNANSIDIFTKSDEVFDVVYLDPMYPLMKKNIKKSGDLDIVRSILEIERIPADDNSLIDNFIKLDYKKLILKRPLKSEKLYSNINYQVKGKTTRFDIYL